MFVVGKLLMRLWCNKELGYDFVREAFQTFGTSYKRSIDKENEELKRLVDNEEREIVDLEAVLSLLEDIFVHFDNVLCITKSTQSSLSYTTNINNV